MGKTILGKGSKTYIGPAGGVASSLLGGCQDGSVEIKNTTADVGDKDDEFGSVAVVEKKIAASISFLLKDVNLAVRNLILQACAPGGDTLPDPDL